MFADHTLERVGNAQPTATSTASRIRFFCLLSVVFTLLSLVLYVRALTGPFVWDEYGLILDNAAHGAFRWENIPSLFTHRYFHVPGREAVRIDLPYYRPVTVLAHSVTYNLFGPIPFFFHLQSLFLHVANALITYLLISSLLSRDTDAGISVQVAMASAFLFLVHPRNVETVCIVANQTALLCTFFSLLSLLFWVRLLRMRPDSGMLFGLSLAALLLAMLAKESAYFVPLLHALLFLLFRRERRTRDLWLLAGPFLLIAVPFSLRQLFLQGPSMGETVARELLSKRSVLSHLGSVTALLFHQLDQWFLPLDIQLFQYPFFPENLTLREILIPILCCTALVWRLRRNTRILTLGLGWVVIAYLPSSHLIPMGGLSDGGMKTGAHHLYFVQPGLALLVTASIFAGGIAKPGQERRVRRPYLPWMITLVLMFALGCQTFRFSGFYRNADTFYQGVLEKNPSYPGAWQNYAHHKLYYDHEPDRAERVLLDGLEAMDTKGDQEGLRRLNWNLLLLYRGNGRMKEAETLLQCIQETWLDDPMGNVYFWTYRTRYLPPDASAAP